VPILPHFFNRFLHNQLTARVIAPSRVIYEHLTHLPGFDVDRTVLLPDGVDLEKFSPKQRSEKIRAEFGVAENVPWIVMVARLQKVKGHEVFFKALRWMLDQPSVCDNAPSGHFRVLCACDERTPGALDATIKLARDYGVPESLLTFTGMRDDIAAIMASADVLVLPSLGSEGSSRVGLEGGASGVPIVASDVGCLPEVIIHRHTGLIVPKNDPHALGQSLLELCQHLDRARLMGQDALAHITAHYDERVMIERLEDVYRSSIRR
jgi:glycosyltransferase involved in cell wall biosynthesis